MPKSPTTAVPCEGIRGAEGCRLLREAYGAARGLGAGLLAAINRRRHVIAPATEQRNRRGHKPTWVPRKREGSVPMMTSAAMRPWRLAGPASGISAGWCVTKSCTEAAGVLSRMRALGRAGQRCVQHNRRSLHLQLPPPRAHGALAASKWQQTTASRPHLHLHRVSHSPDVGVAGAHAIVHLPHIVRGAAAGVRWLGQVAPWRQDSIRHGSRQGGMPCTALASLSRLKPGESHTLMPPRAPSSSPDSLASPTSGRTPITCGGDWDNGPLKQICCCRLGSMHA